MWDVFDWDVEKEEKLVHMVACLVSFHYFEILLLKASCCHADDSGRLRKKTSDRNLYVWSWKTSVWLHKTHSHDYWRNPKIWSIYLFFIFKKVSMKKKVCLTKPALCVQFAVSFVLRWYGQCIYWFNWMIKQTSGPWSGKQHSEWQGKDRRIEANGPVVS